MGCSDIIPMKKKKKITFSKNVEKILETKNKKAKQ